RRPRFPPSAAAVGDWIRTQPMYSAVCPRIILFLSVLLPMAVLAEDAEECRPPHRKLIPAAAVKLSREKDFQGAVPLLFSAVKACLLDNEDDYWLLSDLSVALLRSGDLLQCRRLIAPVLYPGRASEELLDADFEGSQVAETLEHTLGQCTE